MPIDPTWLFKAGRGAGMTRTAVEFIRTRIAAGGRVRIVAPTVEDARAMVAQSGDVPRGRITVDAGEDPSC
jgi:phage terminase large subunit-like protein